LNSAGRTQKGRVRPAELEKNQVEPYTGLDRVAATQPEPVYTGYTGYTGIYRFADTHDFTEWLLHRLKSKMRVQPAELKMANNARIRFWCMKGCRKKFEFSWLNSAFGKRNLSSAG